MSMSIGAADALGRSSPELPAATVPLSLSSREKYQLDEDVCECPRVRFCGHVEQS